MSEQLSNVQPHVILAPRPRQLRDPLLWVLGQLTQFQPDVFVTMDEVIAGVIRHAGYDPDNLPPEWGHGFGRNIQLTYRYGYRDCKQPLTLQGSKAASWGLTDEGVLYARTLVLWDAIKSAPAPRVTSPEPLPIPRTFSEPLLRALGKLSGHTTRPMPKVAIIHATLEEAGYDLGALSHTGWLEPSSNKLPKIHESLRWVARSMSTMVAFPSRGFWALTPLGLERAAKLNGAVPSAAPPVKATTGPNATSKWFSKHLTPSRGQTESELMRLMRNALIKHLPLSAKRDMIEDHVQNFMVRSIRRDSLANMIAAGEDIPYSKVVTYCVRSGWTDARDLGTEPVCREYLGARTERERRRGTDDDVNVETSMQSSPLDTDGNIVTESRMDQEDNLCFDDIFKRIEALVQQRKPGAWGRYTNLLLLKAKGLSTHEIAKVEGVGRHRAAKMLATVRQLIRESGDFENIFA